MSMRRSRHNLTRCSACRAHVRAGETPSTTECPFCGANLREGRARVVVAAGRGGILAASLLALSACGASSSGEATTEPEPVTTDESNENTEVPEPDGEDQFDPPPSDDRVEVDAYGIAPDEAPRPPPPPVDEPRDQPMYGIAE